MPTAHHWQLSKRKCFNFGKDKNLPKLQKSMHDPDHLRTWHNSQPCTNQNLL